MRKAFVAGGLTLTGVAALLGARGYRVFRSVDTHSDYWHDRADTEGDLLYIALGDSTAQGVGASNPADGYVGRLADELESRTGRSLRVVNLSVSGAKVADVVRDQLPLLAEVLAEGQEPNLVTVTIGANDTGRTSAEDFAADMQQVIDALPPTSRVADVPYFRGRRGRSAFELSGIIRDQVAARGDLVQVDLLINTRGLRLREYADDLFHPSALGYERYYRAFLR